MQTISAKCFATTVSQMDPQRDRKRGKVLLFGITAAGSLLALFKYLRTTKSAPWILAADNHDSMDAQGRLKYPLELRYELPVYGAPDNATQDISIVLDPWLVPAPCASASNPSKMMKGHAYLEHRGYARGLSGSFFYLHEPIDPSPVLRCLDQKKANGYLDNVLAPKYSQHVQDYLLLDVFRQHPSRTFDKDKAALQIIGYPTFASWIATDIFSCDRNHTERMRDLAMTLRHLFISNHDDERTWVLVNTWWDLPAVLGESLTMVLQEHVKQVVLLVSDPHSAYTLSPQFLRGRYILIPYVTHHGLEEHALRVLDRHGCADDLPKRHVPTSFYGSQRVKNLKDSTEKTLAAINLTFPNSEIVQANADSNRTKRSEEVASWQRSMLSARFCLVPEGDEVRTPRLFEAFAAGCLPVRFADGPLPFANELDYASMSLLAGPVTCTASSESNLEATTSWLASIIQALRDHPDRHAGAWWTSAVCRGQQAFRHSLSYQNGINVASAIFRRFGLDAPAHPEPLRHVQ